LVSETDYLERPGRAFLREETTNVDSVEEVGAAALPKGVVGPVETLLEIHTITTKLEERYTFTIKFVADNDVIAVNEHVETQLAPIPMTSGDVTGDRSKYDGFDFECEPIAHGGELLQPVGSVTSR
jgi:hypothetical protein